jgi:signal transduction histidine kinase/CheY-like chemotaxis protein
MKNERIPSELLNELLALASSTRDRARLLKQSLALVCKATGARVAAILTDSGNGLRLSAQRGSDAAHLKALEKLLTGASCTETSRPAAELHGPLQDILGCEQVRCIRLIAHHEALGCMLVGAPADAALASFSPELLGTVGRAIGLGIENARLYEQMDQRLRETEVLYRVSVALSSTIDLDALLNLVVRSATETIAKANNGVLHLLDEQTGELQPRALTFLGKLGPEPPGRKRMRAGQGVAGLALETGAPINVGDVTQDARFVRAGVTRRYTAMLVAPLRIGERRIGTLSVDSPERNAFGPADERLLMTLATQAASAIEHARLVSDLQNSLHTLRSTQEQLIQSQKLSAIGRLIAGVAHELNNPLQAVTGYAQLLLGEDDISPSTRRDLDKIHMQAQRAARIVQNLLTFARQQKPERRLVDVREVLERTVELRTYQLRVDNIKAELNLAEQPLVAEADPSQLQTVFLNLINNSHDALSESGGHGQIEISGRVHDGMIHLEFSDDGPGIPPQIKEHLFEPFLTTKEIGKGTGLGLSICFGIVSEHGGRIWAQSEPGHGATFFIELPLAGHTANAVEAPTMVTPCTPGRLMLVVDDEKDVAQFVQRLLTADGHRVVLTGNGEEALRAIDRLAADGHHFDMLISDIKMPGVGGADLYAQLKQRDPELAARTLFITGDTTNPDTLSFLESVPQPSLVKPFTQDDLRRALSQLCGQSVDEEQ